MPTRSDLSAALALNGVDDLEDALAEPTPGAVEAMGRVTGDIIVLGVGGKMGPTLARMAKRASDLAGVSRRVLGVSRFSDGAVAERLQAHGVEPVPCDLLDPAQLRRLTDVPNVVYMTGMKFGSTGQEALTWAMNVLLPAQVCQKFRHSRIVAFSTGNVYGLTPVALGGSRETDALTPVGDYAMSCVGRERLLEHFSRTLSIPLAILRLNYATEMRYGVLVDIALRVHAGQPIDLGMGHVNALWQGDANAMALCAFDHLASPPFVLNLAGPEILSVRRVAEELGRLLGHEPIFRGEEASDALLSNAQRSHALFGYPRVSAHQLIHAIADWVRRGGPTLGKPTHFEARDGQF